MKNGICKQLQANSEQVIDALGWFSIGLGLVELIAPRTLSRLIGVRPNPGVMRFFGLREIISGVGLLTQKEKGRWLKARLAGDALDLAALSNAAVSFNSHKGRLALTTAAVAGFTGIDLICAAQKSQRPFQKGKPLQVQKSITVSRPPAELYGFWHNFEQLPRFMSHLRSVTSLGGNRYHWVARGPAGVNVEWDAQITEDRPNELIAWRSLDGSDVDNSGVVRFEPAPGNRGTVIRVELRYNPPAGKLGANVAKILGEAPEKQIAVDLRRLKQIIETGEIARTEGQPAGRMRSTSRKYDDFVRV